jgi:hypothetical protein
MASIIVALILQISMALTTGQKPADKTKPTGNTAPETAVVNGGTGNWVGE